MSTSDTPTSPQTEAVEEPRQKGPRPNSSMFFSNRECQYFPCHENIDPNDFNCMFCYCPLYMLGDACGGNFTYTEQGRKACNDCVLPHMGVNASRMVMERYEEIAQHAAKR